VRTIVRGQRGKLDFDSKPGETDVPDAPAACPRKGASTGAARRARYIMSRILIVEDDDAIATGLALNLKLAGRETTIARDGDEALRHTTDEDFALVLLDINLPKKMASRCYPHCARPTTSCQ
jgi:PleD family two-component response regulator